jgi:hypothetical protein
LLYRRIIKGFFQIPAYGDRAQPGKEMKKIMRSEPGFPVFREAVTAVNRTAFCWLERYFAFFPTV